MPSYQRRFITTDRGMAAAVRKSYRAFATRGRRRLRNRARLLVHVGLELPPDRDARILRVRRPEAVHLANASKPAGAARLPCRCAPLRGLQQDRAGHLRAWLSGSPRRAEQPDRVLKRPGPPVPPSSRPGPEFTPAVVGPKSSLDDRRISLVLAAAVLALMFTGCLATRRPAISRRRQPRSTAAVKSKGFPTEYWFQYGETTAYGSETPHRQAIPDGGQQTASEQISGLKPDTVCHYRLVAQPSDGQPLHGSDRSFGTLAAPGQAGVRRLHMVDPPAPAGPAGIELSVGQTPNPLLATLDAGAAHRSASTREHAGRRQPGRPTA